MVSMFLYIWFQMLRLMWTSICRNMQNLQNENHKFELRSFQRVPREKSMLYSVTFSSINAQFCNIAFSQMVYCPNWCSYYIPFHLTFIHKLSFSQRGKWDWVIYIPPVSSGVHFYSLSSGDPLAQSSCVKVTCRYSAVLLKSEIKKRK